MGCFGQSDKNYKVTSYTLVIQSKDHNGRRRMRRRTRRRRRRRQIEWLSVSVCQWKVLAASNQLRFQQSRTHYHIKYGAGLPQLAAWV